MDRKTTKISFPIDFKFGAATASYQIEGGWDEDGKSPNIWDTLTQKHPESIIDGSNGNVAANSYHFYQKDIDALVNIGFEFYRFSISWSRIIPEGTKTNMKGIEYYNKLIDGLLEKGIEPLITIYHWDLPQYIQDLGGWTNPLIVDYFTDYADVLFQHFGDRVKKWITVNEPNIYCGFGYGLLPGKCHAPAISSPGVGDYLSVHHTLLAHAATYHLYKEKYFDQQRGQIGFCTNFGFRYPFDASVDHSYIVKALEFETGKLLHPIFSKEGGYPKIVIDEIEKKSFCEGRQRSRLPKMTEEQINFIRGSADFLAINYYSSRVVKPREGEPNYHSWVDDTDLEISFDTSRKKGKSFFMYSVPEGLHDVLVYIKNEYGNPNVMITENGWSDDGQLIDEDRVEYLKLHLAAVSKAIHEDKCNVSAYTVWSLIDNFEWTQGYTEKFGIHYIDFQSDAKERVPKKSAHFFKDLMSTKSFEL